MFTNIIITVKEPKKKKKTTTKQKQKLDVEHLMLSISSATRARII